VSENVTAQEQEKQIHPVHTSCQGCAFAVMAGSEQTGCRLGRLAAFARHGAEVVEAYNQEGEFFVVSGRKCNAFRDKDWAKGVPYSEQEGRVRKELRERLLTFVVLAGDAVDNDKVVEAAKSIRRQSVACPVLFVYAGDNPGCAKAADLNAALMGELANSVTWRMVSLVERTASGELPDLDRQLALAAHHVRTLFFTAVVPGEPVPNSFAFRLDDAVNGRMENFVALKGDGRHLETVALPVHKHLYSKTAIPVMQIIENECPEKAKEWRYV
jgi:hypothetical protein